MSRVAGCAGIFLALLCQHPSAHAEEVYGGLVFEIQNSDSHGALFRFGPTVRLDHDRLGASGSMQFEVDTSGRLHTVTLSPEVGVDATLARVTYGPALELRPGEGALVGLRRPGDLFPRVAGVGVDDVESAARRFSKTTASLPGDPSPEEWARVLESVRSGQFPTHIGEHEGFNLHVWRLVPELSLRKFADPKEGPALHVPSLELRFEPASAPTAESAR